MLTISDAGAQERSEIRALLCDAGLAANIDQIIDRFLVAREQGKVVACAALEEHDGAGLLRSVAVAASHRGRGLARSMVTALIERARTHRLAAVYLLTDTAVDYFARHGFKTISRAQVRPAVIASEQFRSENCASSTVMELELSA